MVKKPVSKVDVSDETVKRLIEQLGPPDASKMMKEALRYASPELNRLEMWERNSYANAGKIFIGNA